MAGRGISRVPGDNFTTLIEGVLVDTLALCVTAIDPEDMLHLEAVDSTGSETADSLTEIRAVERGSIVGHFGR